MNTFSMYLPGNSSLHCADPRAKLLGAIALIVALFSVTAWPVLVGMAVLTALLFAIARIPLAYIGRALRPVMLIMIFTLAVNAVTFSPHFAFVSSGLLRGLLYVCRLAEVMLLSTLVTLTTSPVALTDGLTLLMRPLRRVRVPVDDIAMMLSIALRFIPTIAAEAQTIMRAQAARGARFNEGGLLIRLRAWLPVIIPLLVQLFRRADTLALAMEARCYGANTSGNGRTRLRELSFGVTDWLLLTACVGLALCVLLLA